MQRERQTEIPMDTWELRPAEEREYPVVRELYYEITDYLQQAEYTPGWQRDIYPTQEYIQESIRRKELYIGYSQNRAVSCMILNHETNDGYRKVRWNVEADKHEVLVIHALGVAPSWGRKGYATRMVSFAAALAQEQGIKAIRLDVLKGNLPAAKVYLKAGFQYVETVSMFYEDTGWTEYELYELDLKQKQN